VIGIGIEIGIEIEIKIEIEIEMGIEILPVFYRPSYERLKSRNEVS